MKTKRKYIIVLFIIIIGFVSKNVYDAQQVMTVYEDSVNLILEECYEYACKKLESIAEKQYKDTEASIMIITMISGITKKQKIIGMNIRMVKEC